MHAFDKKRRRRTVAERAANNKEADGPFYDTWTHFRAGIHVRASARSISLRAFYLIPPLIYAFIIECCAATLIIFIGRGIFTIIIVSSPIGGGGDFFPSTAKEREKSARPVIVLCNKLSSRLGSSAAAAAAATAAVVVVARGCAPRERSHAGTEGGRVGAIWTVGSRAAARTCERQSRCCCCRCRC